MKKSLIVLAAGIAIASSSGAQLLGIGAGVGANANLGLGAVVTGTAQAVGNTAAHVGAGASADIRGHVQPVSPSVRGEVDARLEAEGRAGRQGARSNGAQRPDGMATRSRTEWGAEAEIDSGWSRPSPRPMQPQPRPRAPADGYASGSVRAEAAVPRVDLGVRSQTQVRGGLLAR